MSIQITYFVHGTTTDNENNIATGWNPGELSELGKKQARELRDLASNQIFDTVFASDLKRAVDSAELAFGDIYKIVQDSRLREANYGDFTGQPDAFKDHIDKYIRQPFPHGESYLDVEKRMREFLTDVHKQYDGKRIAIVAHQAPQLALEVICNRKTWGEAIATDWRLIKSWRPGWNYIIRS